MIAFDDTSSELGPYGESLKHCSQLVNTFERMRERSPLEQLGLLEELQLLRTIATQYAERWARATNTGNVTAAYQAAEMLQGVLKQVRETAKAMTSIVAVTEEVRRSQVYGDLLSRLPVALRSQVSDQLGTDIADTFEHGTDITPLDDELVALRSTIPMGPSE